jgi:hypothetical protein
VSEAAIQSFVRAGVWRSEADYFPWAQWCLTEANARVSECRVLRNNVARRSVNDPNLLRLQRLFEEAYLLANAAVVFAAMAVESFTNFYGVVRLGEEFYSRNYERMGVVPKLAAVLATCTGKLLTDDSEITRVVRRLSERRNALVHPKTREADLDDIDPSKDLRIFDDARDAIADVRQFFELFVSYDPTAAKWISMRLMTSNLTRERADQGG